MNSIIIETALPKEEKAVLESLSNIKVFEHPITKTQYKIGNYFSNGSNLEIVVGRTNQTNVNAAIETERMIQHFNPSFIFFVGVAGGLKDVKIGDVVIGADVFGFEGAKAGNQLFPRPKFAFSSYDLEMKAIDYSNSGAWVEISGTLINRKFNDKISVYSGTIASGEKVVASSDSNLFGFLKNNCSHALAVEMEGLGFLEACRPYPLLKSLLIRGISDLIDEKEKVDKEGSQEYAIKNAVTFLFNFLDHLNIKQHINTYTPTTLLQKLCEIVTKLYPEGLKDKGIWLRSGGDLSSVQLYSTGKAQWIEALVLIENGGGGDITFETLIEHMKKDYAQNKSLRDL
jgi:nucleoside phosphorylase